MRNKLPWSLVLGIVALLCAPVAVNPAFAATVGPSANQNPDYVWYSNPNNLTGATGTSPFPVGRTVTNTPNSTTYLNDPTQGLHIALPGITNTATGFSPTTDNLTAFKTTGPDEHGLGFLNDPTGDLEIFNSRFIQVNVSQLLANNFVNGELRVQSVQGPETYAVWGSNTAGTLGTLLLSGEGPGVTDLWVNLPGWGTFNYYSLGLDPTNTGAPNNILFDAIGATPVPEPGSILLLGSGLVGFVLYRRRKA